MWPITEVARRAGTTSRTLRHYAEVGLLAPTHIGANGYRYYDQDALARLQRILLLRALGLGIPAIRDVLEGATDDAQALTTHVGLLEQERERLDRQISSVQTTIRKMENKERLMIEEMFDGFDHTQYRGEVTERWGADSYRRGDTWWKGMSDADKRAFTERHARIAADYAAARAAGEAPGGALVQAIVARHIEWLNLSAAVTGGMITAARLRGYGEMYVGDPRFAANYGGAEGAAYVREAFERYADTALG